MTTPKLHTSLAEENVRKAMASGAVQRMGIFPPCNGHRSVQLLPARTRELNIGVLFLRLGNCQLSGGNMAFAFQGHLFLEGGGGLHTELL